MSIDLSITDDFATIIDTAEAVTLKRRASATTIALDKAWRYSSIAQSAEAGVAGVVRTDDVWQFAWPEGVDLPHVGDAIIDATNACWTILSVEIRGATSRLRCVTRNLQIMHQLDDRIEIQEALWEEGESGPEITGWRALRTAIAARIQPVRTAIDQTTAAPTSVATFRILLADDTPLDHNHRLIGPDGAVYQIIEYTQAEQIDALPMATAVKQPPIS